MQAALWDEVKDRLKASALGLSGGQQQRLCIARCLAVEPDVILMDEPASALDPIATTRIEDLMHELKHDYTIVVVTHNMQQAARVADMTAFFSVTRGEEGESTVSSSSTTRRQDLHAAERQADRGLRHRAIRLMQPTRASGGSRHPPGDPHGGGRPLRARPTWGDPGAQGAGSRARGRGDRLRRRGRQPLPRHRAGRSSRYSPGRPRWRPTCGPCSPSSTSTSRSSAWPTCA